MISVTIYKDQEHYVGLECFGHAGFEQAGKDIVCSAVSILIINTINGIEQFTEDAFTLDTKDGSEGSTAKRCFFHKKAQEDNLIRFRLTEDVSEQSQLLMDVLVLGLTEINKQYGDSYLTLRFEEV